MSTEKVTQLLNTTRCAGFAAGLKNVFNDDVMVYVRTPIMIPSILFIQRIAFNWYYSSTATTFGEYKDSNWPTISQFQ